MLEIPDYDPNETVRDEVDAQGRPPLSTVHRAINKVSRMWREMTAYVLISGCSCRTTFSSEL